MKQSVKPPRRWHRIAVKSPSLRKSAAFTLPELLVVVAVLSILSLGLITLYMAQNRLTADEVNLTQAQVDLAAGLNSALPFMQSANAVLASATINSTDYATSAGAVVLSVPAVDGQNNIIAGSFDKIAFVKSGTAFSMVTQAAPGSKRRTGARTLIKKIDALTFTYQDGATPSNSDWFTVEVQQQVKLRGVAKVLSASERVGLRNK